MKLNKGEAIVRANAKSVVLLTVCASVLACAAGLGCLQGCSPQEAASQGAAPKAEAANGSITLTEWTTETDCTWITAITGTSTRSSRRARTPRAAPPAANIPGSKGRGDARLLVR